MLVDGKDDVQAKSIVNPNGVPNSSFRAYRLPIEVLESSTREKTPALRSFAATGVHNQRQGNGEDHELIN